MKTIRFLKLILMIVLCLGFSNASIALSAQDQMMQLGDLGNPPDYDRTLRDFQKLPDYKMLLLQLPSSYKAPITPAKNQGNCGSCWAFASVGVFESHLLKSLNIPTDLSEQQQISCNTAMSGCRGGSMTALQFWYNTGPMEENCTGYCACNKLCSDLSKCQLLGYRTSGYHTVNMGNQSDIKMSIYNEGPAYFRFDVYSDFRNYWSNGSSGSVYTQKSGDKQGGHAVLIFGWDDTKNAWLCKNSWGRNQGPNDDGTFWIAYTGHQQNLNFGMANVITSGDVEYRPLKYGDLVYILNGFNNWNGGYLETCNTGCQGNFLCVNTFNTYDRAPGSGTWKIQSANGKKDGEYVLACENIYLLNQYPYYTTGNGGYLDTRGTGCQGNYLCVSTATSSNRDNGSGTWKIIPDQIPTHQDNIIYAGQVVHILNGYNGFQGGFLDTCGSLDNGNYSVSTCKGWNRDTEMTSCWQLLLSN